MRALSIAAAGMSAQNTNVEVIANNIANVNTTGFKRSRAEFADLLYQTDRYAGAPGRGRDDTTPEGTQVGLGVRTVAVRSLNIQGPLARTGNALDIGINGRGWFQVAGGAGETLYSRAGSLNRNANGQLVTADGSLITPTISIPTDATEVLISEAGQISVRTSTDTQLRVIGQLTLAQFVNETGLEALGGNLFRETPASGAPTIGPPGSRGFGTLNQGYLESSNVDPVKEITELISAQRAYEMNSKVIQAADEMYSTIVRGMR